MRLTDIIHSNIQHCPRCLENGEKIQGIKLEGFGVGDKNLQCPRCNYRWNTIKTIENKG